MKFVVWYCGTFIKAFDTKTEAHEWATHKYGEEQIGHHQRCVINEV